jgi:DNA invertase Pin-like site-specific DNA recombinase
VYETHVHLNRLDDAGVRFRSFTEPYLDSCGMFRDAVISILAVIAKQERIRISERVRAGLSRARAQGTRSGKPPGRPKVVLNREAVRELKSQGKSWREIARACGAGVTTVRRTYASMTGVAGVPNSSK